MGGKERLKVTTGIGLQRAGRPCLSACREEALGQESKPG